MSSGAPGPRTWCLIGVRAVGFVLLVWSVPSVILAGVVIVVESVERSPVVAVSSLLRTEVLTEGARFALGLYLLLGGRWVVRLITRGLGVPGMCPRCGYDVRGLDTARCPECGARLTPATR